MRFRIQGLLHASPEAALRYYHDHLEDVATECENVARVEVLEREPERTHVRWFAKGEIPRAFHRVLSPENLFWEEELRWDFANQQVLGRVFRPDLKAVRCDTTILVRPLDEEGESAYRVEGDLKIDVPMFGPMLERFFIGVTERNVRQFYEGLERRVAAVRESAAPAPAADAREGDEGERTP